MTIISPTTLSPSFQQPSPSRNWPPLTSLVYHVAVSIFTLYCCGRVAETLLPLLRGSIVQPLSIRTFFQWTQGGKIGAIAGLVFSVLSIPFRSNRSLGSAPQLANTSILPNALTPSTTVRDPIQNAGDIETLIRLTAERILSEGGSNGIHVGVNKDRMPRVQLLSIVAYDLLLKGTVIAQEGEITSCHPHILLNEKGLCVADSKIGKYKLRENSREISFAIPDEFSAFAHFHQPTRPFTAATQLHALTDAERAQVLQQLHSPLSSHAYSTRVEEVVNLFKEIGRAMELQGYLEKVEFSPPSTSGEVRVSSSSSSPSFLSLLSKQVARAYSEILASRNLNADDAMMSEEFPDLISHAFQVATYRLLKTASHQTSPSTKEGWTKKTLSLSNPKRQEGLFFTLEGVKLSFTSDTTIHPVLVQSEEGGEWQERDLFIPSLLTSDNPLRPGCFTPKELLSLINFTRNSKHTFEGLVEHRAAKCPTERTEAAQYAKIPTHEHAEARSHHAHLCRLAAFLERKYQGALSDVFLSVTPRSKPLHALMALPSYSRREKVRREYFNPQYREVSHYDPTWNSCFYASVATALGSWWTLFKIYSLRRQAANYIRKHPEQFPEKMPIGYRGDLVSQSRFADAVASSEYASHYAILAMAWSLGRPIHVIDLENPCITPSGELVTSEHQKYGPEASPSNPPLLLVIDGAHFSHIVPRSS